MLENIVKVYRLLKDNKFHTANDLALKLNLSDKTIRKLIKNLDEILKNNNSCIISKASYGYMIKEPIPKEKDIFYKNIIPISVRERIDYLIDFLLKNKEYIKLEDISEKIFVGTKTLSLDLKKVEKYLLEYSIEIERKPHYGIKLKGKEIDIRNLIGNRLEKELNENKYILKDEKYSLDKIAKCTRDYFKNNNIRASDISFQKLIVYIYVSLIRLDDGFIMNSIELENNNFVNKKREQVRDYLVYLQDKIKFSKCITEDDINYITIHFLSNESVIYDKEEKVEEIKELINQIFFYIKVTFNLDLYDDENLYKNMYTHLLALTIRLRFGICITNPILEDIKNNMEFSYNIASYVGELISKRYERIVSEDEIAYIAVILQMAKAFNINEKKNLLIICPTGRGISKFLIYTYDNLFSKYCNKINSCGENELEDIDIKEYDVIFSLVDLELEISKPVYRINYFLSDEDIKKIEGILSSSNDYVYNIFPKKLFMNINKKKTKEEIIKEMSKKLLEIPNMRPDIEELIIKREQLSMTEIGNSVAIPHPIEGIKNVNVIGVCILKYPIIWINKKVKLIFFLCLDNEISKNDEVYKRITKLVDDDNLIDDIVKNANYDYFITKI